MKPSFLSKESRDVAPSNIAYSLEVSDFGLHGTILTGRARRDGELFIFSTNN